ncbi:MAG: hypothetical protein NWF05_02655 [Candidatus Bathyarchaeota archaeon]|nr:hypothetical protein [Candidatus Bathyarchaeota archaeon]
MVECYQNQGIKSRQFWVRSPHTFAFVLWQLFIKIGFYRTVENAFGIPVKIPAVQNSRVLKGFWAIVEYTSVLPLVAKAKICLRRGYSLIAERYLIDTVTTVAFFLDDPSFPRSFLSRALLCFIEPETSFIFLDADYETIYARREKFYNKPRSTTLTLFNYSKPPAENLEPQTFIDFQRKAYSEFATKFPSLRINTAQFNVKETFTKVQTYVEADRKNCEPN